MATNANGHLVDDKENVVVDFVWGNFPLQPNDVRNVTPVVDGQINPSGLLDYSLDNHVIAEVGWNGYPLYVPNTDGAAIDANSDGIISANEIFIVVPNVLGQTSAVATEVLKEAGYTTVTVYSPAATNAAKSITNIARTAGSTEVTITATGATAAYPVGTKITVASTGTVDGTWTVTGNASTNQVKFTSNASTVLTSGTGSVIGVEGTVKAQSDAANAASIAAGGTITITPWAAAS
jgi:rhodanese-related sulfurtransferase